MYQKRPFTLIELNRHKWVYLFFKILLAGPKLCRPLQVLLDIRWAHTGVHFSQRRLEIRLDGTAPALLTRRAVGTAQARGKRVGTTVSFQRQLRIGNATASRRRAGGSTARRTTCEIGASILSWEIWRISAGVRPCAFNRRRRSSQGNAHQERTAMVCESAMLRGTHAAWDTVIPSGTRVAHQLLGHPRMGCV